MDQFHDFLTLSLQICGCWSKEAGSEQSVTGKTGNVGLSIQGAIQVYARFQWPYKTKHYTLKDMCEGEREGEKQAEHVHLAVGTQVLPDPSSFLPWACTWCTFLLSTNHVRNLELCWLLLGDLQFSCAWCIGAQRWMEKLGPGCDWKGEADLLSRGEWSRDKVWVTAVRLQCSVTQWINIKMDKCLVTVEEDWDALQKHLWYRSCNYKI